MQNYTTILGVIKLRSENVPYDVVQKRYSIGSSTVTLIMNRFKEANLTYLELSQMEPAKVVALFYPQENLRRKDIPMPDFQYYYDRIHEKGSKVNIAYCWIEYKRNFPEGYEASQFYEYYSRFVAENYGSREVSMAVERIPGERMYIDWVGDKPAILMDPQTGEITEVCVFVTTIGISSYVYAEVFADEKTPAFVQGTVNALQFYGAVPKYLVPDNCLTAVKKHTKDELILNSTYQDLEDYYDTVILPPPARKPKGKPTVENHVRYLETHLIEKLKEKLYTSIDQINSDVKKIIADINERDFQKKSGTRKSLFEAYDRPHMKPLPGGRYATCEYKAFLRIPENYHLEFDGHYYSVLYTYYGKPAILKATLSEIRICDENNRLICTHQRSYKQFPLYITDPSHMPASHQYYKMVNSKDGDYYRRWATVFGPYMVTLIDTVLKASRHEQQAYNSCAGILHSCKDVPRHYAEEAAQKCVEMKSCQYSTFKKVLGTTSDNHKFGEYTAAGKIPAHHNIRGKEHYAKKNSDGGRNE